METLKEREQKILAFMRTETQKTGYPPTVREICKALQIKSTSTVFKDLENLEKKGYIKKASAQSRAISFTGETEKGRHKAQAPAEERVETVEIPVVGRIAAGTPILAEQNIEDSFPVPSRYVNGGGEHFMLTVHGNSMVEAGILDGDMILVRRQETANNGDIVAAMVDTMEAEATVKTFYKEDGHIRLQPQNPTMSPIIVEDCQILGLVKGVFRYFN